MDRYGCNCKFCNDLRNIEPAKAIGGGDKELRDFLREADKRKKFVAMFRDIEGVLFSVVDECPECGYVFTEEDYDTSPPY